MPAISNALKVLLFAMEREQEWTPDLAVEATEHGTLGLAALFVRLKVDHRIDVGLPSQDPRDQDDREAVATAPAPDADAEPWAEFTRQRAVTFVMHQLADAGRRLPVGEARLLAWVGWQLCTSEYAEIAVLARKFISSDVGRSTEEGDAALRSLIERGLLEAVPELDDERRMALRVVIEGLNDRRQPLTRH
jgi:hypothetical protein